MKGCIKNKLIKKTNKWKIRSRLKVENLTSLKKRDLQTMQMKIKRKLKIKKRRKKTSRKEDLMILTMMKTMIPGTQMPTKRKKKSLRKSSSNHLKSRRRIPLTRKSSPLLMTQMTQTLVQTQTGNLQLRRTKVVRRKRMLNILLIQKRRRKIMD